MTIDRPEKVIDEDLRVAIIGAINRAQAAIQWKPNKAIRHLTKRIRLHHLSPEATLTEYEAIITAVLNDNEAKVYFFWYNNTAYPTIVTPIHNRIWLVMVGSNGVMETAFPPDDPETYLADSAYIYMGPLKELLQ